MSCRMFLNNGGSCQVTASERLLAVDWNSKDNWLAIGQSDGLLKISDGRFIKQKYQHQSTSTINTEKERKFINKKLCTDIFITQHHAAGVSALRWCGSTRLLASGDCVGCLKIWRFIPWENQFEENDSNSNINAVCCAQIYIGNGTAGLISDIQWLCMRNDAKYIPSEKRLMHVHEEFLDYGNSKAIVVTINGWISVIGADGCMIWEKDIKRPVVRGYWIYGSQWQTKGKDIGLDFPISIMVGDKNGDILLYTDKGNYQRKFKHNSTYPLCEDDPITDMDITPKIGISQNDNWKLVVLHRSGCIIIYSSFTELLSNTILTGLECGGSVSWHPSGNFICVVGPENEMQTSTTDQPSMAYTTPGYRNSSYSLAVYLFTQCGALLFRTHLSYASPFPSSLNLSGKFFTGFHTQESPFLSMSWDYIGKRLIVSRNGELAVLWCAEKGNIASNSDQVCGALYMPQYRQTEIYVVNVESGSKRDFTINGAWSVENSGPNFIIYRKPHFPLHLDYNASIDKLECGDCQAGCFCLVNYDLTSNGNTKENMDSHMTSGNNMQKARTSYNSGRINDEEWSMCRPRNEDTCTFPRPLTEDTCHSNGCLCSYSREAWFLHAENGLFGALYLPYPPQILAAARNWLAISSGCRVNILSLCFKSKSVHDEINLSQDEMEGEMPMETDDCVFINSQILLQLDVLKANRKSYLNKNICHACQSNCRNILKKKIDPCRCNCVCCRFTSGCTNPTTSLSLTEQNLIIGRQNGELLCFHIHSDALGKSLGLKAVLKGICTVDFIPVCMSLNCDSSRIAIGDNAETIRVFGIKKLLFMENMLKDSDSVESNTFDNNDGFLGDQIGKGYKYVLAHRWANDLPNALILAQMEFDDSDPGHVYFNFFSEDASATVNHDKNKIRCVDDECENMKNTDGGSLRLDSPRQHYTAPSSWSREVLLLSWENEVAIATDSLIVRIQILRPIDRRPIALSDNVSSSPKVSCNESADDFQNFLHMPTKELQHFEKLLTNETITEENMKMEVKASDMLHTRRRWNGLAEIALRQDNISIAKYVFTRSEDVPSLLLLQEKGASWMLENIYDCVRDKGCKPPHLFFTSIQEEDNGRTKKNGNTKSIILQNGMADSAWINGEWMDACEMYKRLNDQKRLALCLYLSKQYGEVAKLISSSKENLREDMQHLELVGCLLQAVGQYSEAALALERAGNIPAALQTCVDGNCWNEGIQIAKRNNLIGIQFVPEYYAPNLYKQGRILEAAQTLIQCGWNLDACKLIYKFTIALSDSPEYILTKKKLFIAAALAWPHTDEKCCDESTETVNKVAHLCYSPMMKNRSDNCKYTAEKYSNETSFSVTSPKTEENQTDIECSQLSREWLWRCAQAFHLYYITLYFLRTGDIVESSCCAARLLQYDDVIAHNSASALPLVVGVRSMDRCLCARASHLVRRQGILADEINDLEILVSEYLNGGCDATSFKHSNSVISNDKVQTYSIYSHPIQHDGKFKSGVCISQFFDDIYKCANDIFKSNNNQSSSLNRYCPECRTKLTIWATECRRCFISFDWCSASGRPLIPQTMEHGVKQHNETNNPMIMCTTCKKYTFLEFLGQRKFCPLCHQPLQLTEEPTVKQANNS